jgi:hypothetical protein
MLPALPSVTKMFQVRLYILKTIVDYIWRYNNFWYCGPVLLKHITDKLKF